jgi:hypothetical protein
MGRLKSIGFGASKTGVRAFDREAFGFLLPMRRHTPGLKPRFLVMLRDPMLKPEARAKTTADPFGMTTRKATATAKATANRRSFDC